MYPILIIALLGGQVLGSPAPLDLFGEAGELLNSLRAYISAEVFVAHDNLDDIGLASVTYGNTTYSWSSAAVSSYAGAIAKRVALANALVKNSEEDLTHCLEGEAELNELFTKALTDLQSCIIDIHAQVNSVIDDAKYFADVQYNKVGEVEFQLSKCASTDLTCIASVVSLINEYNLQLVLNIQDEVQKATVLTDSLKVTYSGCQNLSLDTYSVDSNVILTEMFACIQQ